MRICIVYNAHPTGSSFYRLELPNSHVATTHPDIDFVSVEDISKIDDASLRTIDLFLISRVWVTAPPEVIRKVTESLREYGAKIILDLDDYWVLESGHSFYRHYLATGMPDIIREQIRLADAVTTTTKYLADKIRPLNPNVHVFSNCPHELYEQFKPEPTPSDKVRFGWFGGAQHTEDIETTRDAMGVLAADRTLDGRYMLYLGGWNENNPIYTHYEQVFSANGRNNNYGRIQAADIYSYVGGYNFVDVCLAPLRDTTFNKLKSELKIVEAGWMGKAVIASDLVPYSDMIDHGVNGFLVKKPKEWYKYMKLYINNPELAKQHGQALQEKVRELYKVEDITPKRVELYKNTARHI
jgi:glycosyltransferase involved in cell wall biosynthesis